MELGVGSGQLFKRLPSPKQGVELRAPPPASRRLDGVAYRQDALAWTPTLVPRTVVMNPPFARQVDFFNRAASLAGARTIVWIAGMNVRLWTVEDALDASWHLEEEWAVPPELGVFTTLSGASVTGVRVVVQVWRRRAVPLWSLGEAAQVPRVATRPALRPMPWPCGRRARRRALAKAASSPPPAACSARTARRWGR